MLPVFSGVRVAHLLLLLCMYDFNYFMFFVVCVCFPCLVFVRGLRSFDYRYNLGSLDYSCIEEVLITQTIEIGSQIHYRDVLPYAMQGMKPRCFTYF